MIFIFIVIFYMFHKYKCFIYMDIQIITNECKTNLNKISRKFKEMPATARQEEDLKRKSQLAISQTKDPLELLRAKCLARGTHGIRGLSM